MQGTTDRRQKETSLFCVLFFCTNKQIVLPLIFNEKNQMALWRGLDYTSAPLRGAVKHPPNNSLKLGKKTNSKPSEMGRSPLNRLANRPIILRSSAYFEFLFLLYLPSVFGCVLFRAVFPALSFFTTAKTIFQSFSSMTLLPENVKNPRKTYFNPFTLFRFRGIKPSATATDKAIRTHQYEPRKD